MLKTALHYHQEHPAITFQRDALLRSVNARLGALVMMGLTYWTAQRIAYADTMTAEQTQAWDTLLRDWTGSGQEFAPLSTRYLGELALLGKAEAVAWEKAQREDK
jgi:hypothetical protein